MTEKIPLPYSPDVEVVPPDELEEIQRVIETLQALLIRDEAASGQKRRDVHVKSHGCPAAQFQILPGLAPNSAKGCSNMRGLTQPSFDFRVQAPG